MRISQCMLVAAMLCASAEAGVKEPSTRTANEIRPLASAPASPVQGRLFRNEFFGLTYQVPKGLRPADTAVLEQERQKALELMGGSAELRRQMQAASRRSRNLLAAANQRGTSVQLIAEDLALAPAIANGEAYLEAMLAGLRQSGLRPEKIAIMAPRRLGAATLAGRRFEYAGNGVQVRQAAYAVVLRRYALLWVFTSEESAELARLEASLNSLALLPTSEHHRSDDQKAAGPAEGSWSAGTYRNGYFALSFPLPPGWAAQDQDVARRLQDAGAETLSDEKLKQRVRSSRPQTHSLFMATQDYAAVPMLMASAEELGTDSAVQNGADYLALAAPMFTRAGFEFALQPVEVEHAGRRFWSAAVKRMNGTVEIYVSIAVTVERGHALMVMSTAAGEQEYLRTRELWKGLSFDTPGRAHATISD